MKIDLKKLHRMQHRKTEIKKKMRDSKEKEVKWEKCKTCLIKTFTRIEIEATFEQIIVEKIFQN